MVNALIIIKNILSFIKGNYKFFILVYAILVSLGLYMMFVKNNKLSEDNNRLSINQVALSDNIKYYKTESGKNAAKVTQLTLTKDEFEKVCADQVKVIKDLNLKLKRVESISTTATRTDVAITTVLKDTVIVRDTVVIDNAKHFSWADSWNSIDGVIISDSVECEYHGTDTLTVVATRVPKKFLCFRYGTKYIEVDVTNCNPSTTITYNRTIKLKKK